MEEGICGCWADVRNQMPSKNPVQDVDRLDFTRPPPQRMVLITTYDLAQKLRGFEKNFGFLICDESHALKNRCFFCVLWCPSSHCSAPRAYCSTACSPKRLSAQVAAGLLEQYDMIRGCHAQCRKPLLHCQVFLL